MEVSKKMGISLDIVPSKDHPSHKSSQRMACKSQVPLAGGMQSGLSDHIASGIRKIGSGFIKGWKRELYMFTGMYRYIFIYIYIYMYINIYIYIYTYTYIPKSVEDGIFKHDPVWVMLFEIPIFYLLQDNNIWICTRNRNVCVYVCVSGWITTHQTGRRSFGYSCTANHHSSDVAVRNI